MAKKTVQLLRAHLKRFWFEIRFLPKCFIAFKMKLQGRTQALGDPIFIASCGHSGSSILLAILDAHPRLHAIPFESHMSYAPTASLFRAYIRLFNDMTIAAGGIRWVEKTPRNILRLPQIMEYAPNAKVIIILRDGRDVVHSLLKRSGSLSYSIHRWLSDNEAGRQYWKHDRVHVMKYEDLITDFDTTLRSLMDFLEEDYTDELKHYHQSPKKWYSQFIRKPDRVNQEQAHKQHRNWQINQPIFDGRGKWKNLKDEELAEVLNQAGPLLKELGYL